MSHSPRDVIVAALAVPLPCPVCSSTRTCRCARPEGYSSTDERATLVEAALVEHGFLPDPTQPVEVDVDEAARWVAEQSRHPRYLAAPEKVLQSEADVELACSKAAQNAPQSAQENLARVKGHLLAAVTSRRASGEVAQ